MANPVPELAPPEPATIDWGYLPDALSFVTAGRNDRVDALVVSALTLRSTRRALLGRISAPSGVIAGFTFGSDVELERLWKERSSFRFLGFPVVAPAFSTWLDASPYEHLVQSIRTIAMARQLSIYNAVVPSVPLSPWVKPSVWGSAFAGAKDIAVDFGSISQTLWLRYLGVLAWLADEFDPTPRLVAYGVGSRHRLTDLIQQWPGRLVIASRAPIDYALKGERLKYPCLQPSKDWTYGRGAALAERNDATFRFIVEELTDHARHQARG